MTHKKILVNSSPGCGNTFCKRFMQLNFDATIVWQNHEINAFREWENVVFILRDPYDALASAIEVNIHDLSEKELEYYNANKEFRLEHKMLRNLRDYELMLNALDEFPLIKAVTFEFLTTQPKEFLNSMARYFDLKFLEGRVDPKDLLRQMKEHSTARAPREKSEERKEIDDMVRNHPDMPRVYKKYLKYKEKIQSTENN